MVVVISNLVLKTQRITLSVYFYKLTIQTFSGSSKSVFLKRIPHIVLIRMAELSKEHKIYLLKCYFTNGENKSAAAASVRYKFKGDDLPSKRTLVR